MSSAQRYAVGWFVALALLAWCLCSTDVPTSEGTVVDDLGPSADVVVRRQGKGTFVATHGEPQVRFRFLRLAPDSGEAVPPERQLLDFKRTRAPAEVARLLDLKTGEGVVMLKRLLVFAGDPVILEETWLPGNLFKGLSAAAISEHKGALYNLFETQFATRMAYGARQLPRVAWYIGHGMVMRRLSQAARERAGKRQGMSSHSCRGRCPKRSGRSGRWRGRKRKKTGRGETRGSASLAGSRETSTSRETASTTSSRVLWAWK